MDTNDLIKNVIQENVVETKRIVHDLLMQKLNERLQAKFEEYAPQTFLDETTEEEVEGELELETELDEANELRSELNDLLEKKEEKEEEEEEDEEEEEEDEEEKMGEDGLVYEDEGCDNCNQDNKAAEMNQKAFKKSTGISEETEQLDEVSPSGMKHMTHSKKARASFKAQYGKRGKSVQYATAWKKAKKDE